MHVKSLLFRNGVVDRNGGVDFGGDIVDEIGRVAPLLDGVDCALVEDLQSADGLDGLYAAIFGDDGVEGNLALNVCGFGYRRVDRRGG